MVFRSARLAWGTIWHLYGSDWSNRSARWKTRVDRVGWGAWSWSNRPRWAGQVAWVGRRGRVRSAGSGHSSWSGLVGSVGLFWWVGLGSACRVARFFEFCRLSRSAQMDSTCAQHEIAQGLSSAYCKGCMKEISPAQSAWRVRKKNPNSDIPDSVASDRRQRSRLISCLVFWDSFLIPTGYRINSLSSIFLSQGKGNPS